MGNQQSRGRFKHLDFMVLDIVCLQLCFTLSYWITAGFANPYATERFQYLAVVTTVSQLIVILLSSNYQGILRRGKLDEAIAVFTYAVEVFLVAVIYLFIVQQSVSASRLHFGCMFVLFLVLDYAFRQLNKLRIRTFTSGQKKSLIVITSSGLLASVMERLDRAYIETWSPQLDFKILLKTIVVVFKGEGAE